MTGKQSPSATALVATKRDLQGDLRALGTLTNGRYDRWYQQDMNTETTFDPPGHWREHVASARVLAPQQGTSTLLLFAQDGGDSFTYGAPYLQISNGSAQQLDVNLADKGFVPVYAESGDITSGLGVTSALLVYSGGGSAYAQSFRAVVEPSWSAAISSVKSDHFQPGGDLFLSWDAFPLNKPPLSPNNIYLSFGQWFVVDPGSWWASYNVEVHFWILIWRNADGSVSGSVKHVYKYVDPGAFHDLVEAIVDPNVELAVIKINDALKAAFSGISVKGLYFMPGQYYAATDVTPVVQKVDAWDDIQIWFEL
jgi:hypothetical protein